MVSTSRCTFVPEVLFTFLHSPVKTRFAVGVPPISSPREPPLFTSHQIAGVIGTGLFLGLGQLLATTGPLGLLLVVLLVGSVAFAFVNFSIPDSRSDLEAVYLVAP